MDTNNGWYKLENKQPGKPQARAKAPAPPNLDPSPGAGKSPARSAPPVNPDGREAVLDKSQEIPLEPPTRPGGMIGQKQMQSSRRPAAPQPKPGPAAPAPQPRGGAHEKVLHSQSVGARGPVLAQDTALHETLEDFVHSTKLGRVVHTKGFGAFGSFRCTQSMRAYTTASIFQGAGQQVPVAFRSSLAVSNPGTPDTSRNVRGFSTKFYAGEGVYDLLCNHIPVFLVRDAIRFPASIRAFQPSPVNNLADPNRFWGFVATAPEAIHFVTWLYSDVGTIKSIRRVRTYGVNTYVWKNAEGERRLVKYHWIPLAGEECIGAQEAVQLAGLAPDIVGQDLYGAIAAGTPVEYELRVQLMSDRDAMELPFDPLDCTKVWDEEKYPLLTVGKMTLDRNPDNYAEQIEKLAYAPSNLIEGIELSDDKMLQGRSFIYSDAQRHRLGNDYHKIPVNRQEGWRPGDMVTSGIGRQVEGVLTRSEIPDPDNFTQGGQRYAALSPEQQTHLVENIAGDLKAVSVDIQTTVLGYLGEASAEMAERIRMKIKE